MGMVHIDPDQGLVVAGDQVFPIEIDSQGSLTLAGKSCIRAITYGERERILVEAQITSNPIRQLLDQLCQTAMVHQGQDPPDLIALVALVLAGADNPHPLPGHQLAALAVRSQRSVETLIAMQAQKVDHLATQVNHPPADPWHRVIFPPANLTTLAAMAQILAQQLLECTERPTECTGRPTDSPPAPSPVEASQAASTQQPAWKERKEGASRQGFGDSDAGQPFKYEPAPNQTQNHLPPTKSATANPGTSDSPPKINAPAKPGFAGIRARFQPAPAATATPMPAGSKPKETMAISNRATIRPPQSSLSDLGTSTFATAPVEPKLDDLDLLRFDRFTDQKRATIAFPPPNQNEVHPQAKPSPEPGPLRSNEPPIDRLARPVWSRPLAESPGGMRPSRSFTNERIPPAKPDSNPSSIMGFQPNPPNPSSEAMPFPQAICLNPVSDREDVADQLAEILELEADLRGLLP